MYTINCSNPILILNPRLEEYFLKADCYYLDGKKYFIDSEERFRLLDGDSPSQVFHFPHVKAIDSHKYNCDVAKQMQNCLDRFLNNSFLVLPDGECVDIWQYVPCGHCDCCVSSKVNSYVQRCMFAQEEAMLPSYFVTLTYNDEHLPDAPSRKDIQTFQKRLRNALFCIKKHFSSYYHFKPFSDADIRKLKFFYVCERGKLGNRLHFHIIVFGLPILSSVNAQHNFYLTNKILQFSWRFPERLPSGRFLNFKDYLLLFPKAFQTPKGYDSFSKGFVNVSVVSGSSAVSYALKYSFKYYDYVSQKDENVKVSSNSKCCFVGSSINLGFEFVKSRLDLVDGKFVYTSFFDHLVKECNLSSYYLRKLFPSESKLIPCELRRAYSAMVYFSDMLFNSASPLSYKKNAVQMRDMINIKFPFLNFHYVVSPRLKEHCRVTFDYRNTVVEDGLEFFKPNMRYEFEPYQTPEFAFVYDLFEKSCAYLLEHELDYDLVEQELRKRNLFFSKFKKRTFSEIALQGLKFRKQRKEMQSKEIL